MYCSKYGKEIIELKDFDYSLDEQSYEEFDSYYDEMVYLIEEDKEI